MEINNDRGFNVTQEFEIIPHHKSKVYTITISDWNFIKNKVSKIKSDFGWWEAFGFAFIGAGISMFIGYFTTAELTTSLCVIITIFCFIIGFTFLGFSWARKKDENSKPLDVIEYMDQVEQKFNNNDN